MKFNEIHCNLRLLQSIDYPFWLHRQETNYCTRTLWKSHSLMQLWRCRLWGDKIYTSAGSRDSDHTQSWVCPGPSLLEDYEIYIHCFFLPRYLVGYYMQQWYVMVIFMIWYPVFYPCKGNTQTLGDIFSSYS